MRRFTLKSWRKMTEKDLTLKIVMRSGQVFGMHANEATIDEMVSHPKFLKMNDKNNDIFVSIEDIAAFEITDFRKETQEPNGTQERDSSESNG